MFIFYVAFLILGYVVQNGEKYQIQEDRRSANKSGVSTNNNVPKINLFLYPLSIVTQLPERI